MGLLKWITLGRNAENEQKEKAAEQLAKEVKQYFDEHLNGDNSCELNIYNFNDTFPEFQNCQQAQRILFYEGYWLVKYFLASTYHLEKRKKPNKDEPFAWFILT